VRWLWWLWSCDGIGLVGCARWWLHAWEVQWGWSVDVTRCGLCGGCMVYVQNKNSMQKSSGLICSWMKMRDIRIILNFFFMPWMCNENWNTSCFSVFSSVCSHASSFRFSVSPLLNPYPFFLFRALYPLSWVYLSSSQSQSLSSVYISIPYVFSF